MSAAKRAFLTAHVAGDAIIKKLAAKAMRGDNKSLEELCKTIAQSVMFRAMRRLPEKMDAEDATQEILMRVCENIGNLKEPKAFGGWLNAIINNEINRQLERNIKRRAVIIDIDEHLVSTTVADGNEDNLPYERAIKKEVRRKVLSIIDKLPERQHEAVMLHYYEGMSITEAAKAMNITKPTICRYLEIAREKINYALEQDKKKSDSTSDLSSWITLPIGTLMTQTLVEEASLIVVNVNETWISEVVAFCSAAAAAGVAAVTTAGIATATGTVGTACTATAAGTTVASGVATATVAATTAASPALSALVMTAISLVAATAVTTGGLWAGEMFPWQNTRQANVAATFAVETQGEIIFEGGERLARHTNPSHAEAWAKNERGQLTANRWWITAYGIETLYESDAVNVLDGNENPSIRFEVDETAGDHGSQLGQWASSQVSQILHEGDGHTLDNTLVRMHENNEHGDYTLWFAMVDAEGNEFLLSREFTIAS